MARDPEKDLALLQIDPQDIFGNSVHFASFTSISPDYTYTPSVGDTVVARGYPWVGANTLTETQGIVSGTYEYNGHDYIKTDALIAGGNSGGPLIRDGKIVGINTFLIGGSSDPSLGYSLLVSEGEQFIRSALTKVTKLQKNDSQFAPFLQKITDISQAEILEDSLITFRFPIKYNITTYIPGSSIDGQISRENNVAVQDFSFLHFRIPALKTPEDIRYFLSAQSFFPFSYDVKFKTVMIGGQSFYEVNTLGNTAGDKTKTQYIYFKIIDDHLLVLRLSAPYSNETTYETIQKNIVAFLGGITFPSKFSFPSARAIRVDDADISLQPSKNSLLDFRSNFFPYDGIVSQFMTDEQDLLTMREYLGNLWSYAQISVVPNSFYTEGVTAADLLSRLKESPYFTQGTDTRLITYKGHDGFIACDARSELSVFDERNAQQFITQCEMILLVGTNNSHFLSLFYFTDRRFKDEIYTRMQAYLDRSIVIA